MSLSLTSSTLDKYFGFLINLDNTTKKRLIIKLTESIEVKNDFDDFDLENLYGAWADSRSTDEIIKEIRNSRVEKGLIMETENIKEFNRISKIKIENWIQQ